MTQHLRHEIDLLKKKILSLSAVVEESVQLAVRATTARDLQLAEEVIRRDIEIDKAEVTLEEDCLKILALHQPVAIDLRFIIAVLKINSDLERIGDEAVNIAERAAFLASQEKVQLPIDFEAMFQKVQQMLRLSLDSLVNLDSRTARQVCAMDDEVDDLNREIYALIKSDIRRNPKNVEVLIHLLAISRHLERIADHATNISEDVIYMIEGIITRHKAEAFGKRG